MDTLENLQPADITCEAPDFEAARMVLEQAGRELLESPTQEGIQAFLERKNIQEVEPVKVVKILRIAAIIRKKLKIDSYQVSGYANELLEEMKDSDDWQMYGISSKVKEITSIPALEGKIDIPGLEHLEAEILNTPLANMHFGKNTHVVNIRSKSFGIQTFGQLLSLGLRNRAHCGLMKNSSPIVKDKLLEDYNIEFPLTDANRHLLVTLYPQFKVTEK